MTAISRSEVTHAIIVNHNHCISLAPASFHSSTCSLVHNIGAMTMLPYLLYLCVCVCVCVCALANECVCVCVRVCVVCECVKGERAYAVRWSPGHMW